MVICIILCEILLSFLSQSWCKSCRFWWWNEYGIHQYPDAKNILIFMRCRWYRNHIFKHQLLKFAQETGLSVIICHYPPYCSKWNPIEHRLFSHIHKEMSGCVFTDYETVKKLVGQTSTKRGLTVAERLSFELKNLLGIKMAGHRYQTINSSCKMNLIKQLIIILTK